MLPQRALSTIVDCAQEGILVADMRSPDAHIIYVNRGFEKITGYKRREVVGKNCRYLQGSDRLQPAIEAARDAIAGGVAIELRLRNYRKDGNRFWNDLRLVPIVDRAGELEYYVGFIRDVTETVAIADQLEQVMNNDQLTGCLSRDGLLPQLSILTVSHRVLLVKLDIAQFHEINSGYGYDVGDALLQAAGRRLSTLDANLVARVGNDQFAMALTITDGFDVPRFVGRLSETLAAHFPLAGTELKVRFAIGYVTGSIGADAMTLVRQAGAALAESKMSPLRRPCEFAAERQAKAHDRLRLTGELQRAISSDEFVYHYQPQIDLVSGRVVGAEALVRWEHALFGLQQPGRFINRAEQTGLILDIGAAGLSEVARFAAAFNRNRRDPLHFSFNVSAIELTHCDIRSFVSRIIHETGVDPSWLTLELTESLFAEDSPEMLGIFKALRDLGVGLSIDDFGTGYSSLRYLERFPMTEIKIDRSFIAGLPHSAAKRIIVEAVIKLGRELGVRVIGEGVEQETERDMLLQMGCTVAQGYLFSPPLVAAKFIAFAENERLAT
jgi:PAS domain S-box-containing protein/diguanylate cyclase (GGDEF)-like protein